jgi:SEC-C motif domain protein
MKSSPSKDNPCPCHSKKSYSICCEPFHLGLKDPTPVDLMRSRYAAYAMGDISYLITTTHSSHPLFKDVLHSMEEKKDFSQSTEFYGLTIVEDHQEKPGWVVTFIAFLRNNQKDISFQEKSLFLKEEGKWKYAKSLTLKKAP